VWNDPKVNWDRAGLCILRSTWDYHLSSKLFFNWVDKISARLLNSSSLVLWNSHKRYLIDLQEHGIKIVPTAIVPANSKACLREMLKESNWSQIIIKPAIGLATFGVSKFVIPDQITEAQAHMEMLLKKEDVLLQKFMPNVHAYGERSLVFIDGKYSHAVRKEAFQRLAVAGQAGEAAITATASEVEFARKLVASLKEVPLYARVDLVPDELGETVLMELELIEPSLFLSFEPTAAKHFADAIERRLLSRRASTEASSTV
jgi:glutathione synthase/RimK-type ligase-like ATP-grasp enzyme